MKVDARIDRLYSKYKEKDGIARQFFFKLCQNFWRRSCIAILLLKTLLRYRSTSSTIFFFHLCRIFRLLLLQLCSDQIPIATVAKKKVVVQDLHWPFFLALSQIFVIHNVWTSEKSWKQVKIQGSLLEGLRSRNLKNV